MADTKATNNKAAAGAAPAPRQRAAVSMERRLALLLGDLVSFCDTSKLKGPAIDAARKAASEVTDKVIKPIENRLTELRKELKGYNTDTVAPDVLMETLREIKRLEARRKAIASQAAGE